MSRDIVAKICTCGRKHSWLEWRDLPRVGFQVGVDETEASIANELRNCVCGSTIRAPIALLELIVFLTDMDLTSGLTDPFIDTIRLRSRVYATAAKTVVSLLEEQRDEAERRARLMQKKVVVAETRAADIHRTLLLRDMPKEPPDDAGED